MGNGPLPPVTGEGLSKAGGGRCFGHRMDSGPLAPGLCPHCSRLSWDTGPGPAGSIRRGPPSPLPGHGCFHPQGPSLLQVRGAQGSIPRGPAPSQGCSGLHPQGPVPCQVRGAQGSPRLCQAHLPDSQTSEQASRALWVGKNICVCSHRARESHLHSNFKKPVCATPVITSWRRDSGHTPAKWPVGRATSPAGASSSRISSDGSCPPDSRPQWDGVWR